MTASRALRRDDLLMPYAFAGAFLLHLLLVVVLPGLPKRSLADIPEYVTDGIKIKVFSMPSTFSRFSATHRLYAPVNPDGAPFASSGNVRVEASAVAAPPGALIPFSDPNADALPVSMSRLHLGARAPGAAAPAAPRTAGGDLRAGIRAPEADEGEFLARDAAEAAGHFGAEGRSEGRSPASGPRAPATRESPGRLGASGAEAEAPGAAAPPLRAPRIVPGTPGYRAAVTPTSAGPHVSDRQIQPEVEGEYNSVDQAGARRRGIFSQPLPIYPDWATAQRVEADVIFDLTVAQSGRVIGTPKLVRTSGHQELDRRAFDAVRQWVFEPIAAREEVLRAKVKFVIKRR